MGKEKQKKSKKTHKLNVRGRGVGARTRAELTGGTYKP